MLKIKSLLEELMKKSFFLDLFFNNKRRQEEKMMLLKRLATGNTVAWARQACMQGSFSLFETTTKTTTKTTWMMRTMMTMEGKKMLSTGFDFEQRFDSSSNSSNSNKNDDDVAAQEVFSTKKTDGFGNGTMPRASKQDRKTNFSPFLRRRDVNGLWKEITNTLAKGIEMTAVDVTVILTFFRNERIYPKAEQLFEMLQSNGYPLSQAHCTIMVEIFGMMRSFEKMNQLIEWMTANSGPPTRYTYVAALKGFIANNMILEAETLFQGLIERNLAEKFSASVLLKAYLDRRDVTKAQHMFDLIKKIGIELDDKLKNYQSIFLSLMKDEEGSKRILGSIPYNKVSAISFIVPLHQLAEINNFPDFATRLSETTRSGFYPNLPTITKWMQTFERNKNVDAINWLYDYCETLNFTLDRVCFMVLIKSCVHTKDLPRALLYQQKMKDFSIDPSIQTQTALLSVAIALEDEQQIESFLREGEEKLAVEIKSNPSMHNKLLNYYASKNDFNACNKFIQHMKSLHVPIDVVSFNNYLKVIRNKPVGAPTMMDVLDEMDSKHVAPTDITADIFLRFFLAEIKNHSKPRSLIRKDLERFVAYWQKYSVVPSPNNESLLVQLEKRLVGA